MAGVIETTLRQVNLDESKSSKWKIYSMTFNPSLDNKDKRRYDIIEQVMNQMQVPSHAFHFNGTNLLVQSNLTSLGPWNIPFLGEEFEVQMEPIMPQLENAEASAQNIVELLNRIFAVSLRRTKFTKIRDKYIIGPVSTFQDKDAELYRGFTLTVESLGENNIILKHKIVHRLVINRTLDNDEDIFVGSEIQSIYDHKNTYFYEKIIKVNIDRPMTDDSNEQNQNTFREHYMRKFQRKLETSALKRPLWQKCLTEIRDMPSVVDMVECHHAKDYQICKLFKSLTTRVEIPIDILRKVPQAARVSTFERFKESKNLLTLLGPQNNREQGSHVCAMDVLQMWGIALSDEITTREFKRNPAPTVTIQGHNRPENDLKPNYMKDVRLSVPIPITSIGVCFQPAARNVYNGFWTEILQALKYKNGGITGDISTMEIKGRNFDEVKSELMKSPRPHQVYVFFLSGDKLYGCLKKWLTGDRRTVTQFVQAQNQRPKLSNPGSVSIVSHNIALQILCKLGACPWTVTSIPNSLQSRGQLNLLLIGIDVSHGKKRFDKTVGASKRMSYVGLSAYFMEGDATTKSNTTKFFGLTIQQAAGQEVIDGTKLRDFFEKVISKEGHNSTEVHYPHTVMVFRDGVGKGQIESVRDNEVTQITDFLKDAATTHKKPRARLVFTVATKRISENFALDHGKKDADGGIAVIDSRLCTNDEFYLVTDKRIGFVHYNVIHSDGITRDDVMKVAYDTSFAYFNWPGPIKVPATLQYAHTISKLAGEHFDREIKCASATFNVHRGLQFL